jgi:hypothetical protein
MSKSLRLDSGQNNNWDLRAAPVAVLSDASTFKNTPKAAEYAKCIVDLFAKIQTQLLYQGHYAGKAFDSCSGIDVECEAMVSALIDSQSVSFDLTLINLQNTVNLLLERVKELENSHAQ